MDEVAVAPGLDGQVRFELLGTFRVIHGGEQVDVGGPTAQSVLVTLLLEPSHTVLVEQVIARAWGHPGGVALDSVYHYASTLRRALAPLGVALETRRPGYRLDVSAETIDSVMFERLLTGARSLRTSDPEEARRYLQLALGLWRGPTALAGLTLPGVRRFSRMLDARRLDAEEELAELNLGHAHPGDLIDRLRVLTHEHPGRGGLAALLARALHAAGCTPEAVSVCDRATRAARDRGNEPHPKLADAARDIRSGRYRHGRARPVTLPFQLPADTSHFTGRAAESARLLAMCPRNEGSPTSSAVYAIDGMPGVGKSALAIHAAHQVADQFPDGCLFLDLAGFTPHAEPMPSGQALETLLRGLGVPGEEIPVAPQARVGLYRSTLVGRRVLIVLDNAATERQVQPLIPGTAGCLVLITSRRRLTALDDACHLTLDPLGHSDALALFRSVAGDRGAGDTAVVEEIVDLSGHLPLAIRITAARLRTRPSWTPSHLARRLRDSSRRLAELRDSDHRSVRVAFTVSYRNLTEEQRSVYRLLSLVPGSDVDARAVAALAASPYDRAEQVLDELHDMNLLQQPAAGRYRFHDLLRTFAETESAFNDEDSERDAALERLFTYYRWATAAAALVIAPHLPGTSHALERTTDSHH